MLPGAFNSAYNHNHNHSAMPDSQQSCSTSRPSTRSSHSKRHASFNSPREVPLPSPTLTDVPNPFSLLPPVPFLVPSASSSQLHEPLPSTPRQPLTRQLSVGSITLSTHEPRPSISRVNSDHASSNPSAIYPPPRPFSLPQSVSYSARLLSSTPKQTTPPHPIPADTADTPSRLLDRFSSASLPLPSQIPFHILPKATFSSTELPSAGSRSPTPEMPSAPVPTRSCLRFPPLEEISSSSSSSSSGSRDSMNTTDSSDNPDSSAPTSVRSSSDIPSSPTKARANDASTKACPNPNLSSSANATSEGPTNANLPRPQPRPVSPFRAPQPPAQRRPPPTAADFNTAMRRFMMPSSSSSSSGTGVPSSYPPPEPPVILPYESAEDASAFAASMSSSSSSAAAAAFASTGSSRLQAPYVPFLSHAPPPPDSWIQVETTMSEYRLNVRLPGFSREGITLATKRRRILHVVADSWENGGGHFERRISFGYDADLVQVRAEFDGVMLRIVVPRRASPVVWQSQAQSQSRSGTVSSGPSYAYSQA